MIKNISNLGDAAVYCDFGEEVDKRTNSNVIKYFRSIQSENFPFIKNLTPSYNKLIISYDLKKISFIEIKKIIENIELIKDENLINKKIEIPVCCDTSLSLDIERVEQKLKLKRDKIFENFLNKEYFCYMTGFVAGMPFLGDLDPNMRVKRLETPRVNVPKGSVGITEQFTNVYTFESPGGWNIIGNTPLEIFNSDKEENPNLINPGDTVFFKNISIDEYKKFNDK